METGSRKRKMTWTLAAGAALRLFYVLFSTIYDRQYDIGMIDLDAGHTVTGGHLAYIQYLYENWHLPDFDPTTVYQFNHPPMSHYVSALWMKLLSFFVHDTAILEESIQVVPFVCSLLILWVLYKTVQLFELKENAACFVLTLFAFHPALVLLSGSVNNDCMSLLFTVLCVYTTICWSRTQTMRNVIKIAVSLGLGMLTKQNVAEMAFPIALVFLYVLVMSWKQRGANSSAGKAAVAAKASGYGSQNTVSQLLGQFAVFGLVSIPLGMCFYIRNMILYKMPLVWIYTLPEDSWQYTGNVPVLNRLLWPIPAEMADNLLHFKLGCGYNVWMQIIRTSVLGEWDMANVGRSVKVLAVLLMAAGAFLAVMALYAFVRTFLFGGKKYAIDMPCRLMFVAAYVVNLFFYLKFAYDYPQECSMHFRYIEIELLFPAVALGIWGQNLESKWGKRLLVAALGVFCMLSVGMIGVWCLG